MCKLLIPLSPLCMYAPCAGVSTYICMREGDGMYNSMYLST